MSKPFQLFFVLFKRRIHVLGLLQSTFGGPWKQTCILDWLCGNIFSCCQNGIVRTILTIPTSQSFFFFWKWMWRMLSCMEKSTCIFLQRYLGPQMVMFVNYVIVLSMDWNSPHELGLRNFIKLVSSSILLSSSFPYMDCYSPCLCWWHSSLHR